MLAAKRGDFVATSLTIAQYMVSKFNLDKKLYISSRPDDNYLRHFLVLNGRKDIQLFLNRTIFKMATDPIWLAALEKFGAADLRVTKPENLPITKRHGLFSFCQFQPLSKWCIIFYPCFLAY